MGLMATNLLDLISHMQGQADAGTADRKQSQLAKLASQAYTAPQGDRQGLVGQAIGVDPQSGFALDKSLQGGDDARMKRVGQMAGMLVSMPAQARAQAYPGIVSELHSLGLGQGLQDQWSEELLPYAQKLSQVARDSGSGSQTPAQQQYAEWLLSQVPADQRSQALGVLAGTAARPSGAAIQYKESVGNDGVTRMVAYDPRQVGAQAIGSGDTYGSGVGGQPSAGGGYTPGTVIGGDGAQARVNIEGIDPAMQGNIAKAVSAMRAAGLDPGMIDSFVSSQLPQDQPQAPVPPQQAPQQRPWTQNTPNPFQSRPQEQQKYLDEQAQQQAQISALPQRGAIEATNAGMKERATQQVQIESASPMAVAKSRGEAAADWPRVKQQSLSIVQTINTLLKHPGLKIATGLSSKTNPQNFIPGQPGYDFRAKMKQLGGKAFLQAFQSLKGGGQITEVEGQKATDAIAALDTAQSTEQFVQSLKDLQEVANKAMETQTQRMTGGQQSAPKPQGGGRTLRFNPATGKIE